MSRLNRGSIYSHNLEFLNFKFKIYHTPHDITNPAYPTTWLVSPEVSPESV